MRPVVNLGLNLAGFAAFPHEGAIQIAPVCLSVSLALAPNSRMNKSSKSKFDEKLVRLIE